MVCLVKNVVCISKGKKNVIQNVVDIVKEPLHLSDHDLTVGSLVVTLPESKVSEWQAVIGEQFTPDSYVSYFNSAVDCNVQCHS